MQLDPSQIKSQGHRLTALRPIGVSKTVADDCSHNSRVVATKCTVATTMCTLIFFPANTVLQQQWFYFRYRAKPKWICNQLCSSNFAAAKLNFMSLRQNQLCSNEINPAATKQIPVDFYNCKTCSIFAPAKTENCEARFIIRIVYRTLNVTVSRSHRFAGRFIFPTPTQYYLLRTSEVVAKFEQRQFLPWWWWWWVDA